MASLDSTVDPDLLLKRKKNSEAARRCRDKVKQRIQVLEHENGILMNDKRELQLRLVETETMLRTKQQTTVKLNERILELEQRLHQLQKYLIVKNNNNPE